MEYPTPRYASRRSIPVNQPYQQAIYFPSHFLQHDFHVSFSHSEAEAEVAESCMLIQKLLGLVNLGGQEGTPPTIRVVKKHELAVILADFVFRQGSFSAFLVSYTCFLFTPLPVVRRGDAREFQDQRGFTTGHPRLESSVSVSQATVILDTQSHTLCRMPFRLR